jgi:hypothetical protein
MLTTTPNLLCVMMAFHPNWKALSTVDFTWKQFVREGCSQTNDNIKIKKVASNRLTGDEAKRIYEEVVGSDLSLEDRPTTSTGHSKVTYPSAVRTNKCQDTEKLVNALMTEAQNNNVAGVKALLSSCCDINMTDQYGWTPLMSAACAGALDVVKFLISHRADVSLRDRSGNTCLSLARRRGHLAVVQAITEDHKESDAEGQPSGAGNIEFYCESCKQTFRNTRREHHATSTVHLFNTRPQGAVPTMYSIPASNKGYQILVKGGWDREKGLGPEGSGHKFPLKTVLKQDRMGLGGHSQKKARVTHFSPCTFQLKWMSRKTSSKYNREAVSRKERALRRELGDML